MLGSSNKIMNIHFMLMFDKFTHDELIFVVFDCTKDAILK